MLSRANDIVSHVSKNELLEIEANIHITENLDYTFTPSKDMQI